MTYVPILDLSQDDDLLAPLADRVCTEVGFFQVVEHGVDAGVEERMWDALQRFFDLPLEEKLALQAENAGDPYGYLPMSAESLSKSLGVKTPGDVKESINIGPLEPPSHTLSGPDEAIIYTPNRWPGSMPEFAGICGEYYQELTDLSERIMTLFARALQLSPDHFDSMINHAPSAIRGVNYPATTEPPAVGQLRAGAHTDYGLLTILKQDAVGGLQVLDGDENWVGVPSVPGAYVINIGDLMARWTNDRWRSTLHRVVNPVEGATAAARRQSIPFFYNANWDAEVACLPSCLAPGVAAKYQPVVAGPHLMGKFRRATAA